MIALDKMLDELLLLEIDVKEKVKRIEAIRTWCKQQGSFSTELHVCSVKSHSRTGLVSLEKAVKALGRDLLENFELINTSTFLTVQVSKKSNDLDIAL